MDTTLRGGAVVARQAHNLKAVGSIPAPATKNYSASCPTGFFCAVNHLVLSLRRWPLAGLWPLQRSGLDRNASNYWKGTMSMRDRFFEVENCDRCGKPLNGCRIQSMYNHEVLCMDCKDK